MKFFAGQRNGCGVVPSNSHDEDQRGELFGWFLSSQVSPVPMTRDHLSASTTF
jgi:hypothetical protein